MNESAVIKMHSKADQESWSA